MVWVNHEPKLDLVMVHQSININPVQSLSGWLVHDVPNLSTVHSPWLQPQIDTMSPKHSCFSPTSHTASKRWQVSPHWWLKQHPPGSTSWWYSCLFVLCTVWVGSRSMALSMPNAGTGCMHIWGTHLRKRTSHLQPCSSQCSQVQLLCLDDLLYYTHVRGGRNNPGTPGWYFLWVPRSILMALSSLTTMFLFSQSGTSSSFQ